MRLYLAPLVLIPFGIVCVLLGHALPAAQSPLAITLVVLGAGLLVFGAFGPRMQGPFRIGPSGAKGGLAPADARMLTAAQGRLADATQTGEIPPAALPQLEEAATDAVLGAAAARRRYRTARASPPRDPADVGRQIADAILEAARAQMDRG